MLEFMLKTESTVQHSNIYPQRSWFVKMVVASMVVSLPLGAEADEHFVPPHPLEVTESVPGAPSRRVCFRMAAMNCISASRRILRLCYENFQDLCLELRLITDVVRNLGCYSIVLFILLAFPISAVCMGAANVHQCPANAETPILVLILGLLGCLVCLLRIVNLVLRAKGNVASEPFLMVITFLSAIATLSFLMAETITFLNMSPEFDNSSKDYCNKTFYNYTYYSNFVTLGVSFLAMILHFPCCVPFIYYTYLRF
ncbi:hypothetical protein NPIL_400911 [Nephila pilipes]|uniref:Uncharacterized protein n=1 Tax=Nephila pilipes TaxID=299642 RepID=A0A8X6UCA3_NEPPI|nr:hypothetical protein NPIL_400911 [Nephila pilipes]